MKRLLTLAMTVMALSASATDLWTGSCTFASYKPDADENRPVITAEQVADANVGDAISVSLTENTADPSSWHSVQLWDPEIKACYADGGQLPSGAKVFSFTIDATLLEKIKDTGFALAGTGYIATKVELVQTSNDFDGIFWEGNCSCPNWTATPDILLPGSTFAQAKVGDVFSFDVKKINPEEWAGIQIDNTLYTATSIGLIDITQAEMTVEVTFTEALLAEIQAYGIHITGANFELTKIYVAGYDNPDPGVSDGVFWEGECSCPNWTATPDVLLAGSVFASAQVGDILAFDVQRINKGEWAGLQIDNTNYMVSSFGMKELTADEQTITFTLTEELLAELQKDGIHITGANILLTKIYISGHEVPGEFNGVFWEGECSCPSWTATPDVMLAGSVFAPAKVSDVLAFDVHRITEGDWAALQIDNTNYTVSSFGTTELAADAQTIKFTLTEDLLAELQKDGIHITGANIVLTKIYISTDATSISNIAAEGQHKNVIYDINGRQLPAPARGINIINGHKVIVK